MNRSRVLVVDDDDIVRRVLVRSLKRSYEVTAVACGAEALVALESEPFDAVVSDQAMPGMTGVELLHRVRQRDPSMVRILLTGYYNGSGYSGGDGVPLIVAKPRQRDLEQILERALAARAEAKAEKARAAAEMAPEERTPVNMLHDLASLVQGFTCSATELDYQLSERGIDREVRELLDDVNELSTRMHDLYTELRNTLRVAWAPSSAAAAERRKEMA